MPPYKIELVLRIKLIKEVEAITEIEAFERAYIEAEDELMEIDADILSCENEP